MDEIIKVISDPLVSQGVLGITTLIFLGLYVFKDKALNDVREEYAQSLDALHREFNKELRDQNSQSLAQQDKLINALSTFNHTAEAIFGRERSRRHD